ncbi:MAG: protein phosphatase CheZ [Rhodovarius sp.]|nr:protein phosphatase CheZ [Rhodovarius sp.]MCX7933050.1 protein phosphatase CheZ [Rhodovarius sp.]MDW8314234.1 protein phosphatase CheZ [Rhodovarius sp.]
MPEGAAAPREDELEQAVRRVLASVAGDLTATEAMLLGELQALSREIARARQEMAALRLADINARHIPVVTDELDAVVAHTAEATNTIIDACEGLERLAAALPPAEAEAFGEAVTRIYEACSFQDITGQRISKVVSALKTIEERLRHLEERFGPFPEAPAESASVPSVPEGRALAHGPQLPHLASSQADIDSLLASFD